MKSHYLAIGLIAGLGATTLSGATDAIVEATSAEARIAAQHVAVNSCANCHGRQGRSIAPKFPVLAGQHAGYLAAQLHAFKAQTRGDPDALGYMWGMAAPLDDEMINALAAYYARSPAAPISMSRAWSTMAYRPARAATAPMAPAPTSSRDSRASTPSTCSSSCAPSRATCATWPSCTVWPRAWR